jgi:uncharacterized protein YicC (UPF0701 family)
MRWEALARAAFTALSTIDDVVASVKERRAAEGVQSAADALTVIGAIVESIRGVDIEKVDPAVITEELSRLKKALDTNDNEADRALKEKFSGG